MKCVFSVLMVLCIAANVLSQDNPFFAAGYNGPTQHDLFMGAKVQESTLVSTQHDFYSAPDVKPVPMPATSLAPKQAPMACHNANVTYVVWQYRQAPRASTFAERRAERRANRRASLGGFFRGLFGGC